MIRNSWTITVLALAGCGAAASDSTRGADAMAGEGVVTFAHDGASLARAPRFVLADEPSVIFGGTGSDPAYDLSGAREAVFLADGGLAILAKLGVKLLVFDGSGRGRRVIGRLGQGPGEFMRAGGLFVAAADTLLVVDPGNGRLNRITLDGEFVATERFNGGSGGHAVGRLADGRIVMATTGTVQPGPLDSSVRLPATVALVTPGKAPREIATVPGSQIVTVASRYRGRPGARALVPRLGLRTLVVAWDTLVVTATGEAYRLDLRDGRGRVVARITAEIPRRPVTPIMCGLLLDAALEQFKSSRAERMVDPAESERLERITPCADSLAAYGALHVSPDKTLWVVDMGTKPDTTWSAIGFRGDGTIVGRMTGKGWPATFGVDRVAVWREDADGVLSLQSYRVVPAPGTEAHP